MHTAACHICGSHLLQTIPGSNDLLYVTSDSKPWMKSMTIAFCNQCHILQKKVDQEWMQDVQKIYDSYTIYQQGCGSEQAVFDNSCMLPRSQRLVKELFSHINISNEGRLLDIGYGNGAFLRAFSEAWPNWILAGTELDDKNLVKAEQIKGVQKLYSCPVVDIPGEFDIISMVHLLEHIPNPAKLLNDCQSKLKKGGILILEFPGWLKSPFDLLVADHCTHFTEDNIEQLLYRVGYEIELVTMNFIPKEITVVARKGKNKMADKIESIGKQNLYHRAEKTIQWLDATYNYAKEIAKKANRFGLFGTSNAAAWLFGGLQNSVSFFVDEDPNRIATTCFGLPVYAPEDVPNGSEVFIAMPYEFAEQIKRRLSQIYDHYQFYVPL